MIRFARFLLCFLLLITTFSTAAAPTAAQGEVPPPAGGSGSEAVMPTGPSASQAAGATAQVMDGPSEAVQAEPTLTSDEMASLEAYRKAHPNQVGAVVDYYSIPGSTFQPRNSASKMNYYSGGCIYATGSVTDDDNAFTAPVNLPDGAVILGMRFYGVDNSDSDMNLNLHLYDGGGNSSQLLSITSAGTRGAINAYGAMGTPLTVSNFNGALSVAWYRYGEGNTLVLCGAKILYVQPSPRVFTAVPSTSQAEAALPLDDMQPPAQAAAQVYYTFIAGHDFLPRNSSTTYSYGKAGCTTSPSGGTFVADANLPKGATLLGARLYFNDTSTTESITLYITTYDGWESTVDLLTLTNGSIASGYGSMYAALTSTHIVDQYYNAMVVQAALPADTNVKFCGARLFWSLPDASGAVEKAVGEPDPRVDGDPAAVSLEANALLTVTEDPHYRFIAGSAFQPRSKETTYAYQSGGCIYVTAGNVLTAELQLPAGAKFKGVRLYTYDTAATDSHMYVGEYDGTGNLDEILTGTSSGNAGFASRYIAFAEPHTVDTNKFLALSWNPFGVINNTMRLCGMRAYYTIETHTLYVPFLKKQ